MQYIKSIFGNISTSSVPEFVAVNINFKWGSKQDPELQFELLFFSENIQVEFLCVIDICTTDISPFSHSNSGKLP